MKSFLTYNLIILISVFIIMEMVLRAFDMAGHTVPSQIIDNNLLNKPGTDSIWVRGGLGEIKSHYVINKQGYNSLINYCSVSDCKVNVAIIGDSYIAGFHSDVEQSVGRILEKLMDNRIEVHEYGRDGANVADFSLIFEKYIKGKYDFTFVFAASDDFIDEKPSFMGNSNKMVGNSVFRTIYNNVSIIRYFNINHGLGLKLRKLIFNGPESIGRIHYPPNEIDDNELIDRLNYEAISAFDSTVVYIHEGNIDSAIIAHLNIPTILINHAHLPKDHGFDRHWNVNGRLNCAQTIREYLDQFINEIE